MGGCLEEEENLHKKYNSVQAFAFQVCMSDSDKEKASVEKQHTSQKTPKSLNYKC